MSMEKIHLSKLLKLFYLPANKRTGALRDDIRAEIKKAAIKAIPLKPKKDGGDFHGPFWTDAKRHVAGELDLKTQSKIRIDSNERRRRLYEHLTTGFLKWWNEKRRWQNEPFELIPHSIKGQLSIPGLHGIIKVENMLAVSIGSPLRDARPTRIVYPYFSELPPLSNEAARLGLWAMASALRQYSADDIRILDVLRSTSFARSDVPFQGDEEELFTRHYGAILREWKTLWEDYP